jgi:hypothetical protein
MCGVSSRLIQWCATVFAAACLLLSIGLFAAQPARASTPDVRVLEERVGVVMDRACRQLAVSDPDEIRALFSVLLPWPGLYRLAAEMVPCDRDEMCPRAAASAMIEAAGLDCSQLLYYAAVALFIDVVIDGRVLNIPYIELIADVLVAATILCYLGVL